jgi:crossover junction endodeoxyribonuclease RuvC
MRILGVDPGSRLTGFGCVDLVGNTLRHVAHGTLRLSNTGGKAIIPLEVRLLKIHQKLTEVIEAHRPDVMVVERVFFAKNAVSALKLGQARGATILSGMIHGLEIVEYSASEIKLAVVGHGGADKKQVAQMVAILVGQNKFETADASDGLAVAICHAHQVRSVGSARGQFEEVQARLKSGASKRKTSRMSLADAVSHHIHKGSHKEPVK